jgi:predicted HAD superfamily Cof-like phosphohydrolase
MQAKVAEFHRAFGHPIADEPTLVDPALAALRYALLLEEVEEYREACEAGDLVKIADALADIQVVLNGTALVHGMDIEPLFNEAHRSNMTKLGADGKPIHREDGKILKGPTFEEPDFERVLKEQM